MRSHLYNWVYDVSLLSPWEWLITSPFIRDGKKTHRKEMLEIKICYFCHSWRTFFFIKWSILRAQESFKILFPWFRLLLLYPFTIPSNYFSTYSTCTSFFGLSILPLTNLPLPRTGSFKDIQNFSIIHEMSLFIHDMQNTCFTFLYSTIKLSNRRLSQVGSTGKFLFSSLVFMLMKSWNLFFSEYLHCKI